MEEQTKTEAMQSTEPTPITEPVKVLTIDSRIVDTKKVDDIYLICRMYPQDRPRVKDHVYVTYKEIQQDYGVRVTLNEYNDCEGTIYLAELTRRKQIKSLIKECPIGHTVVAEVLQSDPNFISLSKRNMVQADQDKYQEWFGLSRRLQGVLKKIAFRHKIPLVELCKGLSWPLYENINNVEMEKSDQLLHHPYNILADKVKIANLISEDTINIVKDYLLHVLADHDALFGTQSYNESFTVQMLSYGMDGVNDLKTAFDKCIALELEYGTKLDIVMDECPKYTFKFSGPDPVKIKEHMAKCMESLSTFKKCGFFESC